MPTVTKVAWAVVVLLVLALAGQQYVVHRQNIKLGESAQQLKDLNQKVVEANEAAKTQMEVAKVTEQTVTAATKRINTTTERGVAIKTAVDNVTHRVANEQISNTVASAAYIDSMWDAYCEAEQDDSACASRQSAH